MATFRERLEPEVTLEDLSQRASKALTYAGDALLARDYGLLARALDRLYLRWQQWDDLAPAAHRQAWVYRQRASALCDLMESAVNDVPADIVRGVWEQIYRAGAGANGLDPETREAYVRERMALYV